MQIESAYALANFAVRLEFLAMERSLRATGCDLPLSVFPYDERRFDLPCGSQWVENPLQGWLESHKAHPTCRKYFCLTKKNYFFTDTDIIYLDDPRKALAPLQGFVVADTEWNKPEWTYTPESARLLYGRTSTWQKSVFSSGQFACDRVLYTEEDLIRRLTDDPLFASTCLGFPTHEQPGMNLLVATSGVEIVNLNLPPHSLESAWAGDYPGEFAHLWERGKRPYFMHWAGPILEEDRPINALFLDFLTAAEKAEWQEQQARKREKNRRAGKWPFGLRILNAVVSRLYPAYYVQPRKR